MRTITLSTVLLMLFPIVVSAQLPSVHSLRNTLSGRDRAPRTLAASDGAFYVYNNYEGSGDSVFTSVTRLSPDLEPEWNRIFKMRVKLEPYELSENADGSLALIANANISSSNYFPQLITISPSGNILSNTEITDSTTGYASLSHRLVLQNGNEILLGDRSVAHVSPGGAVNFSREVSILGDPYKTLIMRSAKVIPGTSTWVGLGVINESNLLFYSRWEDSTLINLRVYDTSPVNSINGSNAAPYLYANGDVAYAWRDGVARLHLARLASDGSIIWWKTYNQNGGSISKLKIDSNGDFWVTGSITPGQAGGIIAHFSPTGEYIDHKGQFKLGHSHGNISGFEQLSGGDYFALQSGYDNSDDVLFLNRISSDLIFQCFDAPIPPITDTVYTIIDSAVVTFAFAERGFAIHPQPSSPLIVINSTVIKDGVVCTPTGTSEMEEQNFLLFPNPATQYITIQGLETGEEIRIFSSDGRLVQREKYQGNVSLNALPNGLYLVEAPKKSIQLKFIKEE